MQGQKSKTTFKMQAFVGNQQGGKFKLQKYTFTLFEALQHQNLKRLTCPGAGLSTVRHNNVGAYLGVPTVLPLGMFATLLLGVVLLLVAARLLRAVGAVLWDVD